MIFPLNHQPQLSGNKSKCGVGEQFLLANFAFYVLFCSRKIRKTFFSDIFPGFWTVYEKNLLILQY